MDDLELARKRLAALKGATFQPGTNPKRFVRDTALDAELTERQIAYIAILAWKFRRQIPAALVPHGTPPNLPPKEKVVKKPQNVGKSTNVPTIFSEETLEMFEGLQNGRQIPA